MTIRKRYDEAQALIRLKQYEPALILLLIAVAGAAERRRQAETGNAKKMFGDDRKWFVNYVAPVISLAMDGRHAADILYGEVRCTAIHEAKIEPDAFEDGNFVMAFDGAKLTFGLGLLTQLSELVRKDPLGRDDFRDLLNEFENLVTFAGSDLDQFRERFADENMTSGGRVSILENIVVGFLPERLASMKIDEMQSLFSSKLLPNLAAFDLNEACLTGLRGRFSPSHVRILDDDNALTQDGYRIIVELSKNYHTLDAA